MKKTFAVVALLAALGVFLKLAVRETAPPIEGAASSPSAASQSPPGPDIEAQLLARYPAPKDHALVERTLGRYRQMAVTIERTDGLRGLALLDRLDLEAIYLYEKYPSDFRPLRDRLHHDHPADLLLPRPP